MLNSRAWILAFEDNFCIIFIIYYLLFIIYYLLFIVYYLLFI
ncbi:ATP synthase subunit A, partial [Salmonella enterica subsp. enterica serovar Woodinville]|nr:ATP synthase subunit A [Salmonella enterica subsp. enterica serovar Woodinville]